jgi:hypothetical protein
MRRPLIRPPLVALALGLLLAASGSVVPPALAPLARTAPDPLRQLIGAAGIPVVRAADGIGITTEARYVVDPDDGVVRVIVDVTARNEQPDTDVDGTVTRYYYDAVNIGVQPEARRLRASQGDATTGVRAADREGYRLVTLDFARPLFYGESATVRLRYDLPAGKPRSASDVRVGEAFASFLAWSFGDSGTVRVDVPGSFEVDVSGQDMRRTVTETGVQVFRAKTSDPLSWYAWINARNDDGLTRRRLELEGGETVVVRGWPEDTRWQRRVASILGDGIPALRARIGLPWPVDGELSVLEIHTPLLEGYAGFYNPATDEITIGEDLDDTTIVHEASHAWFNQRLFGERWITEGLAETYATDVVEEIGGEAPRMADVEPDDPDAFRLNEWPPPSPIRDEDAGDREQFGYDASHAVVREIVEAAGDVGMRAVFEAADEGTTAYPGEAAPERTTLPENDWRRFLDLVEELGGVEEAAALLETWALTADEAALLDERASAREAFEELDAADGEWAAPAVVRLALDGWDFAGATAAARDAGAIAERWDGVESLASSEGLDPPDDVETGYEAAVSASALQAVAAEVGETEASLRTVAAASDTIEAPRDWLTELGLQGKDPDGELAAARAAWEAGSFTEASELASVAAGTVAVAPDAGRGRALVIGGLAGLALLLVVVIVGGRRRAGARRRAAAAEAVAEAERRAAVERQGG